jgi:hypothetical protein
LLTQLILNNILKNGMSVKLGRELLKDNSTDKLGSDKIKGGH